VKKTLFVFVAAFLAMSSDAVAMLEVLGGSPPGCC
jgi:hypothetical protein